MKANQLQSEGVIKTIFYNLSSNVMDLINLNVNGKAVLDEEPYLNDKQSETLDYNHLINFPNEKMTRKQYLRSISNHPEVQSVEPAQKRKNSLLTITDYIKDNIKEREMILSHCSSFSSDVKLLNESEINPHSNALPIYKPIPMHSPVAFLGKIERESNEELKEMHKPNCQSRTLLQLKRIVDDNRSSIAYQSYLSSRRRGDCKPKLHLNSSQLPLRDSNEIQRESQIMKEESERRSVGEVKQVEASLDSLKASYEEKKKLLTDYYHQKSEALKSVKESFKQERQGKNDSFQPSLKDSISCKANNQIKDQEVIAQQSVFTIENAMKKDEKSIIAINDCKANSLSAKDKQKKKNESIKDDMGGFELLKQNSSFVSNTHFCFPRSQNILLKDDMNQNSSSLLNIEAKPTDQIKQPADIVNNNPEKAWSRIVKQSEEMHAKQNNGICLLNLFNEAADETFQKEKTIFDSNSKDNSLFKDNPFIPMGSFKAFDLFKTPSNDLNSTLNKASVSEEEIKELIEKEGLSKGSLFNASNPFLKRDIKPSIPEIFKCPSLKESTSLFASIENKTLEHESINLFTLARNNLKD